MIKSLVTFLLISTLLSLGGLFVLFSPSYESSLIFQGQLISIDRDQYGIPHIKAPSRRSFLYAWGHALAEDRLFQITFRLRFVQGRLSEFLGEVTLPADIMMRDLGLTQIAHHITQKLKKEDLDAFEDFQAFADGINHVADSRLVMPYQFYMLGLKWEKWTVEASYLLLKMVDLSTTFSSMTEYIRSSLLSSMTKEEVEKIMPDTKKEWAFDSVTIVKDEELPERFKQADYPSISLFEPIQIEKILELGMPEIFVSIEGSNSWVVSGKHTESGKPILSGDPHLDTTLPSHWYQLRATFQQNGKAINFAGVSIPGVPLAYGKTDYLAASMTVIYTDTQDLFKQRIKGNKYLTDGEWKDLKVRKEKIFIKSDGELKEYKHTVKLTHRGPLINYLICPMGSIDLSNQTISMSWVGYNEDYQSLVACSRHIEITNFDQLKDFLFNGTSYTPSLNMVGATADNHIAYRQMGTNPIRRDYKSGSYVKDGTTSKHDWLGFMPPEDRLLLLDPERGFIVAANNQAASSLIHGGYYEHTILTARADRLEQVLSTQIKAGRKITNKFAKRLLFDTVDRYCFQILPQIIKIVDSSRQFLQDFDCDFKSSSFQASMYQLFYLQLWKILKPKSANNNISIVGFLGTQQYLYNYVHQAFWGDQNKQQSLKKAWNQMKKELTEHFQTSDHTKWLWGNLHRDVMVHLPLGMHPLLGKIFNKETKGWGNSNTINAGIANKMEFGNYATTHRANFRSIYDFGGPSWWVIDHGVSQNILSAHNGDQWKLFMDNELLPLNLPKQDNSQLEL